MSEFDPLVRSSEFKFERLSVWARIMHLPFGLMNDHRGKGFSSRLGHVEKMDVDANRRAWGEYLHVRVSVNITKPLLRCLSVFSQSRKMTEYFAVKYENLPIFCYSCGLIGHSSSVFPTPAERDEDGLLPYHGPRLCALDERKKNQSGAGSGHSFSSGHSAWSESGHTGPTSQSQDASAHDKPVKNKTGDVTSPAKTKVTKSRKNLSGANTPLVMATNASRMSGQKRKVYRVKNTTNQLEENLVHVPVTESPTVEAMALALVLPATQEKGVELVAEPYKKQRKDARAASSGSAETAMQSRRMQ